MIATLLALKVCLLPMGKHDPELVEVAARGIRFLYAFEVKTLAPAPLPEVAWYAPRKRWRAEKLLAHMDEHVFPKSGCDLMMGFTAEDISTTKGDKKDWGVLGLASIGGPSGMVSSFRASKGPRRRTAMRVVKVMNHELGHTLGLEHGGEEGCLMNDAGGTVKTVDRESGLLCGPEREAIEKEKGIRLPDPAAVDWKMVIDG